MRRKISKRKRKEAISLGAQILSEHWIREPGWKRKQIGYGVKAMFDGWTISSAGYDELDAYHLLLDCLKSWDEI